MNSPETKVRCPYCRNSFELPPVTQPNRCIKNCPHCHKLMMLPPGLRPPLTYRRSGATEPRKLAVAKNPAALVAVYAGLYRRPGFLLTAIVLTVLLSATVASLKVKSHAPQAAFVDVKAQQTTESLQVLRTALDLFSRDCGRYPTTAEGLMALIRNPGIPKWHGPYIDALKPDHWYRPYRYTYTPEGLVLYSLGEDGLPGTRDDLLAPPPDLSLLTKPVTPDPYGNRRRR